MNTIKALLLLAVASLAACVPTYKMATPGSFVEIENDYDAYDYRAVTADGMVMAVRAIEHDPKGESKFWLEAIQNRMRDRGGYALLETIQVKSLDGVPGTQLRFGHDESGKPHLYYLTLFVTDARLFLLEAGGTKEQMVARAADVDAAVRAFDTTQ
jgi:hypothetical protein